MKTVSVVLHRIVVGSALALSLICAVARASDPLFVVSVMTIDSGPLLSASVSFNKLQPALESAVDSEDVFSFTASRAYLEHITLFGYKNAAVFSQNGPSHNLGTQLTVTLAPTGFSKTFTTTAEETAGDQAIDFFKGDGKNELAAFWQALSRSQPVAVNDGNPESATALSAASFFSTQGFTSASEIADGISDEPTEGKPKFGGLDFGINGGHFTAGPFDGNKVDLSGTVVNFGVSDQVRVLMNASAEYLTLDGAKIYGAGSSIALPIRFLIMNKQNPWNWRVTPFGGFNVQASEDLLNGSLLWQAGVVNSVDYRVNSKLVVCIASQFSHHQSIGVSLGGVDYDPEVKQEIFKNGLRLVTPLTKRWLADAFVVDTDFLKDAAVKQFWTFGGSISYRVARSINVGIAANYDTGKNFKAYNFGLNGVWKW